VASFRGLGAHREHLGVAAGLVAASTARSRRARSNRSTGCLSIGKEETDAVGHAGARPPLLRDQVEGVIAKVRYFKQQIGVRVYSKIIQGLK
jgi:hypothetical protein